MKKLFLTIAIAIASLTAIGSGASSAQAQNGYVYLGGAFSFPHCQQIAGAAGYTIATYGGFVNGIYVVNACFGSFAGGGSGDLIRRYDVRVKTEDLATCKDDIEWEVSDVRCSENGRYLRCVSRRGDIKAELDRVNCVDYVIYY